MTRRLACEFLINQNLQFRCNNPGRIVGDASTPFPSIGLVYGRTIPSPGPLGFDMKPD